MRHDEALCGFVWLFIFKKNYVRFFSVLLLSKLIFCLDGLMRIEDNGIKINHSYFHKKEFLGEFEEEKKFRLNIDKNIDKILQVRDILKNFYKPMKAKGQQIFCLKKNILNTTDGIVIMALISLGVKYKRVYPQDIHPYFYCNLNDKGKKLLKKSQKSILEYYFM